MPSNSNEQRGRGRPDSVIFQSPDVPAYVPSTSTNTNAQTVVHTADSLEGLVDFAQELQTQQDDEYDMHNPRAPPSPTPISPSGPAHSARSYDWSPPGSGRTNDLHVRPLYTGGASRRSQRAPNGSLDSTDSTNTFAQSSVHNGGRTKIATSTASHLRRGTTSSDVGTVGTHKVPRSRRRQPVTEIASTVSAHTDTRSASRNHTKHKLQGSEPSRQYSMFPKMTQDESAGTGSPSVAERFSAPAPSQGPNEPISRRSHDHNEPTQYEARFRRPRKNRSAKPRESTLTSKQPGFLASLFSCCSGTTSRSGRTDNTRREESRYPRPRSTAVRSVRDQDTRSGSSEQNGHTRSSMPAELIANRYVPDQSPRLNFEFGFSATDIGLTHLTTEGNQSAVDQSSQSQGPSRSQRSTGLQVPQTGGDEHNRLSIQSVSSLGDDRKLFTQFPRPPGQK